MCCLEVCFSSVELGHSSGLQDAKIAGVSFKGALRHYLADRQCLEVSEHLFGSGNELGQIQVSDLCVAADVGSPSAQIEYKVALNPSTGNSNESTLRRNIVIRAATFRGQMRLANGGVFPSIMAYQAISPVLPHLRLGSGVHRGHGCVEAARMERNFDREREGLNPLEAAIRDANQRLIIELDERPDLFHSIEWRDLERVIALCYEEIGFDVKLTKSSGDGGKDIVLQFMLSSKLKLGSELYIEIKHWRKDRPVGLGPIRKLYEAKLRDAADGAVLLSTSGFTDAARKLNDDTCGMKLGDMTVIRNLCRFFVAARKNEDFGHRTLEEIVSPTNVRRFG